jgi:hypothetical protein
MDKGSTEEKLTACSEKLDIQNNVIEQLERLLTAAKDECTEHVKQLQHHNVQEKLSLEAQVSELRRLLEKGDQGRQAMSDSIGNLKGERVDLVDTINRLECEKQELNKKLSSSVTTLEKMTTATIQELRLNMSTREKHLLEQKQAADAAAELLKEELHAAEAAYQLAESNFRRELNDANNVIRSLTDQYANQEGLVLTVRRQLLDSENRVTAEVARHRLDDDRMRAKITELERSQNSITTSSEHKLRELQLSHQQDMADMQSKHEERQKEQTESYRQHVDSLQEKLVKDLALQAKTFQDERETWEQLSCRLHDRIEALEILCEVKEQENLQALEAVKAERAINKHLATEQVRLAADKDAALENALEKSSKDSEEFANQALEKEKMLVSEVDRLKRTISQLLADSVLREEHLAGINQLLTEKAQSFESERLEWREASSKELHATKVKLQSVFEADMVAQSERFRSELDKAVSAAESEAKLAAKVKYQGQLKVAVVSHKAKLEEHYNERDKAVNEEKLKLVRLQDTLENAIARVEADVADAVRRECQKDRLRYEADTRCALEARQVVMYAEFEERLRNELDTQKQKLQLERVAQVSVLDETILKNAAKLAELQELHNEEISKLSEAFSSYVRKAEVDCAAQVERSVASVDERLNMQKAEFEMQQMELRTTLTAQLEVSQRDMEQSVLTAFESELRKKMENDLATAGKGLEEEFSVKLESAIAQHKLLLEEEYNQSLKSGKAALEAESVQRYNRKLHDVKARFSTEYEQFKLLHHEELSALSAQHQSKYQLELEIAIDRTKKAVEEKLGLELGSKVAVISAQHGAELESQKNYYTSCLTEKDALIDQLRTELQQVVSNLQNECESILNVRLHHLNVQHQQDSLQLQEKLSADYELMVEGLRVKNAREISKLRSRLESSHSNELAVLHERIANLEIQHAEALTAAAALRHDNELRIVKADRDKFDLLLQDVISERDSQHAVAMQACGEALRAEIQLLIKLNESERIRFESELERKTRQSVVELQQLEQRWEQRFSEVNSTFEYRLSEALAEQLERVTAGFQRDLAKAKADETLNAEKQLAAVLRQQDRTEESYSELSLSLAKQRAEFEHERLSLSLRSRNDMTNLQRDLMVQHSENLAVVTAKFLEEREECLVVAEMKMTDMEARHAQAMENLKTYYSVQQEKLTADFEVSVRDTELRHSECLDQVKSAHNDKVLELEHSLSETQSRYEKLKLEFQSNLVSSVDAQNARLYDADVYQKEVTALRTENSDLLIRLNHCDRARLCEITSSTELSAQLSASQAAIEEKVKAVQLLEDELKRLEAQSDRQISDLVSQNEAAVKETIAKIRMEHEQALRNAITEKESILRCELQSELVEMQARHVNKVNELKKTLENERDEALAAITVAASDAAIEKITDINKQMEDSVRSYVQQLSDAATREAALITNISELTLQCSEKCELISNNEAAYQQAISAKDDEIRVLQVDYQHLDSQKGQQYLEWQLKTETDEKSIKSLENKLSSVTDELLAVRQASSVSVVAAQHSVSELQLDVDQMKIDSIEQSEVLRGRCKDIKDLEERLSMQGDEMQILRAELADAAVIRRDMLTLRSAFSQLQTANITAESENRALRAMNAEEAVRHQLAMQALTEELEAHRVSQDLVIRATFEAKVTDLTAKVSLLEERLENKTASCTEFCDLSQRYLIENKELAESNESITESRVSLLLQVEQMRTIEIQHESVVFDLNTELVSSRTEIVNLKNEIMHLTEALAEARGSNAGENISVMTGLSIQELESERSMLRSEVGELTSQLARANMDLFTSRELLKKKGTEIQIAHNTGVSMALRDKEHTYQKKLFLTMQEQVGQLMKLVHSQSSSQTSMLYIQGKNQTLCVGR